MAPLADDRKQGWLHSRWSELVANTPGRGEFALRLALICALTTWVGQAHQLPEMALSAYVVFFMNRPDRTSSIMTCIAFTVLISVVIGLLLLIANAALDLPALRVAIMASLSMTLLFLASASKLKPLASTISLILAYALDVLGKVPQGELATRALLYAWLIVAVPAGISVMVSLLIGPAPRRLATRAIAFRLRAAQALVHAADAPSRQRVVALRRMGNSSILGLVHLVSVEKTSPASDVSALRQAARSIDTLLMVVQALDGSQVSARWREAAACTLGEMAAIMERNLYPVDIEAVLATFAMVPPSPAEVPKKKESGFFVADAWSNPEHVRYAIKVTFAAMACYFFYSLSDWPGIHTCLITCYIVALPTAAETVAKMLLRIAGALMGAAAGLAAIVWAVPSIDHLAGLLALVFAGALAGGWIAAGSPRISYAGFQVTFAFFLCVIQGSSPAFDLSVARDRVIGILLGNAVVYLIFVYVWPVSIAGRIDAAMAALLRQCARIARLPGHAGRREQLPGNHAAVSGVVADLDIARYEPASLRPRTDWFEQRQAWSAELARLEVAMLVSDDRAWLDAVATHLDRTADAAEAGEATVAHGGPFDGTHGMEQNIAR